MPYFLWLVSAFNALFWGILTLGTFIVDESDNANACIMGAFLLSLWWARRRKRKVEKYFEKKGWGDYEK